MWTSVEDHSNSWEFLDSGRSECDLVDIWESMCDLGLELERNTGAIDLTRGHEYMCDSEDKVRGQLQRLRICGEAGELEIHAAKSTHATGQCDNSRVA